MTEFRAPRLPTVAWRAALEALADVHATGTPLELAADVLVAEIDARIGAQLDVILHAPAYQRLEAAWRGLAFVVERVDFAENVQVHAWNARLEEIADDLDAAPAVLRTSLFRWVFTEEFGQYGGTPYGAVLVDHAFGPGPRDVSILRAFAAIGAMAHAPFFVTASPALLGLRSFDELPGLRDLAPLGDDLRTARFRALRESADARYLGVLLPRMLLRRPFREEDAERLVYTEQVVESGQALFGSPVYAWATRLAHAFARERWCFDITGASGGRVEPVPAPTSPTLGVGHPRPMLEALVSERTEVALAALGFIALTHDGYDAGATFVSAPTLYQPRSFGASARGKAASLDDKLGAQFPYLFIACRIAHYVKVLQRDLLGGAHSPLQVQERLNAWLGELVVDMNTLTPALRARYPLRRGVVTVAPIEGQPGWYQTEIKLQPHLRYMGAAVNLAVTSRMETPR
ncbi:MAG: type VI secretion system contractile sheath large subunit [Myxococcales bacterium]|nr:type VI secretion system contractile sheath large subunit [Myxococcales bacterium]